MIDVQTQFSRRVDDYSRMMSGRKAFDWSSSRPCVASAAGQRKVSRTRLDINYTLYVPVV